MSLTLIIFTNIQWVTFPGNKSSFFHMTRLNIEHDTYITKVVEYYFVFSKLRLLKRRPFLLLTGIKPSNITADNLKVSLSYPIRVDSDFNYDEKLRPVF